MANSPRPGAARELAGVRSGRVYNLELARRTGRMAAVAAAENSVARSSGSLPTAVTAVGSIEFLLRAPGAGGGRMLTEAGFASLDPSAREETQALRGTICLAGPPAHSLGEIFFNDLPSAVGDIWRAAVTITEPGMCMDVVLEEDGRVLAFSHGARAITVLALDASGNMLSRRRYDPFALIDGLTRACERFERMLRACDLGAASRTVLRQFSRPAFPRVLPDDDGPA